MGVGFQPRSLALESLESRLMMAADFGDAPAPYRTLLAQNGARHEAIGLTLGALRDTEVDGVAIAGANGDGDDDDGVTFGSMRVGQLGASVTVNVQTDLPGAKLDAWIDFNADGVWGGLGEQIANNRAVVAGDNAVVFDIPSTAVSGPVIARFRLSTAGNLAPTGAAADGEVEDYQATLSVPGGAPGSFSNEIPISTLTDQASTTDAVDMDGDGDMDVLYAGYGSGVIRWQENNGSEMFTARTVGTGDSFVRKVLGADVDGDGDMDVVTASSSPGRIVWYENNGSESFTSHEVAALGGAFNVVVADIDGDGDMDMASVNGNKVNWHQNNGSQVFTTIPLPGLVNNALGIFAADVDGDGDMDLLSAAAGDDKVNWHENNGSQVFTTHAITTVGSPANGARSVVAADLDNDGDMDVVSASTDDDRIAWYENNGSQVFTTHTITTAADGAFHVYVADMDNDGDLDILSASFNDSEVRLYTNSGVGSFISHVISTSGTAVRSVVAADIDGDGDLDILAAASADDSVVWYKNKPAGDFDRDSDIDGSDFLMWQRDMGAVVAAGSGADGNGDTHVDGIDLALWRAGFGSPLSVAASGSSLASASVSSSSVNLASTTAGATSPFAAAGSNWFVAIEAPNAQTPKAAAADAERQEELCVRDVALAPINASPAHATAHRAVHALAGRPSGTTTCEVVDEIFAEWVGVAGVS